MVGEESKKILEDSYADLLKDVVNYIVTHDEQARAYELSGIVAKAMSDNLTELKLKPRLLSFYNEAILKLKFLSLPLLEDREIIDLTKNNFCFQLKIEYYNLRQKVKTKLLNTIIVEDRQKLKDSLRKAILENDENITSGEIKLIRDWLKEYVSRVGLDNIDKLAKTQYLVSLKGNKSISQIEYDNLLTLFDFYDYLNLAIDSPEGFDEEVPIVIGGQLYIFRQGILEEVRENQKVKEAMLFMGENVVEPANQIDDALVDTQKSQAVVNPPLVSRPSFDLAELEQALTMYPKDSLEHKAISQEISRLKRSEFKQAQKIDAKL